MFAGARASRWFRRTAPGPEHTKTGPEHTPTGLAVLALGVVIVVSGCSIGPSQRPDVAVPGRSGGVPAEGVTTPPAQPAAPPLATPTSDLAWVNCGADVASAYAVTPGPAVVIECATFQAPVDPDNASGGEFPMAATRVRLASTPVSAPPVVFTTGADTASEAQAAVLASAADTALIAAHPVVAIDRRGVGRSAPFDCGSAIADVRRPLFDLGQFTDPTRDPVDRTADLGRAAATACTDFLQPDALAFGLRQSASDLEALRNAWKVDTMAIIGAGNGASVALAYASAYPRSVSRLILDSPTGAGVDVSTVVEQSLRGQEAAFDAFAGRCTAGACSLGTDPRASTITLVQRARAGQLGTLSARAVTTAIADALAFGSPADPAARTALLSDALAAALRGDTAALSALVDTALRRGFSDGQYVSRCTDAGQVPATDRIRQLQTAWNAQYPIFGSEGAVELATCTGWPTTAPPPLPTDLGIPVMILSGTADAVAGNGGVDTVRGSISAAGAAVSTVTWAGLGHPTTTLSSCVRTAVATYLDVATEGSDGTACPA